mgnify:CR=1 FL=1
MTSLENETEPRPQPTKGFAISLIVLGFIALSAAFALVLERIHMLENPASKLSCDLNAFISCGSVMKTAQSHIFGFPNPLIGLMGFSVVIAVGFAILAGAEFKLWFWRMFNAGIGAAMVFVLWLFTQSTFAIQILCPYCMVVWAAVVPMFWNTLLFSAREGIIDLPDKWIERAFKWYDAKWIFAVVTEFLVALAILIQFWPLWRQLLP